jgi:hypothetical protein
MPVYYPTYIYVSNSEMVIFTTQGRQLHWTLERPPTNISPFTAWEIVALSGISLTQLKEYVLREAIQKENGSQTQNTEEENSPEQG